jgi:hypothetical protein
MNKIVTIATAMLALIPSATLADHVGEKPLRPAANANVPRITRITSDRVEFSTTNDDPVVLAVYDIMGNNMLNNGVSAESVIPSMGRGSFRLSFRASASGTYFITLKNHAGIAAVGVAEIR